MLWLYLKICDWDWIFGRAVKVISSLGVRSLWVEQMKQAKDLGNLEILQFIGKGNTEYNNKLLK